MCQNRLKILPNTKISFLILPKAFKIFPWQNFDQSGRTDSDSLKPVSAI